MVFTSFMSTGFSAKLKAGLRTVTLGIPPQEIITRDNIPARVTAVAYYRVIDPNRAVTEVEH